MTQQEGTDFYTVLGSSLMQGCELPEVHSINTGTMLEQEKKPFISRKSPSTTTKKHMNRHFIIKTSFVLSHMNTHTKMNYKNIYTY